MRGYSSILGQGHCQERRAERWLAIWSSRNGDWATTRPNDTEAAVNITYKR